MLDDDEALGSSGNQHLASLRGIDSQFFQLQRMQSHDQLDLKKVTLVFQNIER